MLAKQIPTSIEVTVANIYGLPIENLGVRLGRREQFTAFTTNIPLGSKFLALDRTVITHKNANHQFGGPRLLVEEKKNRRFVFTETGDEGFPAPGQPYRDEEGNIAFGRPNAVYAQPYQLLVYREEDAV